MKRFFSMLLCAALCMTPLYAFAQSVPEAQSGAASEPTAVPEGQPGAASEPTTVPEGQPGVTSEPTAVPEEQSDVETPAGRLAGIIIGIDPGHQAHANNETEPVSPGSKEKKAKVSSGTAGVKTRVAEYVINLDISLKLRDALVAEGATVIMTRETNDVDISNVERAQMMNDNGAQLFLRIHCNGSTDRSANGIGLYVRRSGGECADEAYEAAKIIMPYMLDATGANEDGIFRRDNYSGLNWAEMPSILVEMGFMSNPDEDVKLNDPEYQDKMVSGMVEGVCAYFASKTDETTGTDADANADAEVESSSSGE